MAEGRDPIQEQLRRSHSLSLEVSHSTRPVRDGPNSSVSMEGLNAADIDAIVNKKWMIDEVIGLVRSKLAVLTGGRDKRGAPIITITCNEHSNVRPINVGKLLSYLSKAVDEPLQGKGFTIVLDMQKSSWAITKNLLKSLQLTFVEHIHHVFVVKPKAFWQKRKVGVSLSMHKARYNFPVVLLDSSNGLLQYLPAPQVHKELGGSLIYNHDEWIDAQRCLEKHLLELKARLEGIESLREQLERDEDPVDLNEARDAVRRHVDARSLLDKGGLDTACEAAFNAVAKLKGCSHPDITDFFNRIDELCGTLQSTRGRLQQIWDEKGGKLDQVLQLRIFESDSSQLREWVEQESGSLSREHTDIGDSHSNAAAAKQRFADFNSRVKLKSQELKRVVVLGERLVAANHYAADDINVKGTEVKGQWDRLLVLLEERQSLLTLSMSFFDRQQKFFDNVEEWLDVCGTKDTPPDIHSLKEAIACHKELQETFQTCYSLVREEGHKIIEKLRKPVGDSSLPQAFVARTRVVKEILESMFDEKNWLDEQWNRRNVILEQTLHLRQYQKETKEVYEWLENVGRPFLTAANSIGERESDTIQLLKDHDAFEKTTNPIYATASQLFTKATHLAKSGQCKPELIERESLALEGVVNSFASGLDTRRETILQAQEVFKQMEQVISHFDQLTLPMPRSQFIGSSTSDLELSLSKYSAQHTLASSITTETYTRVDSLLKLLKTGSKVKEDLEQDTKVDILDFSDAVTYLETRVEGVRRDVGVAREMCERRERLWNLSIQFNQLEPDVDEHISSLGSWTQEQENWEWEPASNFIDAQLQLDAFQRQYNQFVSSHDELVTRGQSVAKELAELDMLLFGETGDHSAVKGVEVWVGKLEGACQRMRGVAGKKMDKLKSCLQFHLLQQRATQLTSELTTLSSSLAPVSGVGETLEKAEQLKQQAIELSHKSDTVSSELEQYQSEVEECVKARHYQATSLKLLAKSLQEKRGSVASSVEDKLTLVTAAVEFHQDARNLLSSVDQYELQVNSEDTITSLEDVDGLVRSSNELHTSIQELAGMVKSSGIKLGELVMEHSTKHPSQKTFNLDFVASPILSKRTRTHNTSTNDIKADGSWKGNSLLEDIDGHMVKEEKRKSWDILDSKHAETIVEEEQTAKTSKDMPKLLVAPRRARAAGMKAAKSMPSLGPSSRDHDVIDNLLEVVSKRASIVEGLWSGQIKELEQLKEVVGYREDVLRVVEWVESVGDKFLERKNELGRSIEEVKSLIAECKSFADKDVTPFSNLVNKLDSLYQALVGGRRSPRGGIADKRSVSMDSEGAKRAYTEPTRAFSIDVGGRRSFSDGTEDPKVLREMRALRSTLESKWGAFERDFKRYSTKMDLSLKFNEVLFETSNWCQMTEQFLDEMEDKVDLCTSAPKAKDLIDELDVYMSVTNDQQSARLEQLKHTSEFLHSNTFKDLTNQVARSTSRMLVEVETRERNLKKMAARFTQIENDKDRERMLTNKREHVMEELLQTEVRLVADLKLILKCRPRFMRADMLPNSLKGKEAIIFGNINEIEAFHRTNLLPGLQEHSGEVEHTAHLFVKFADEMKKIYVPFCRDKSASEELLTSHRSYLNRVQSLFVTDTPLSTLLIKPVQRITKYPLLLKDLLKYTGQLGEPTSVLEEAVRAVERIPVATNNALHLSYLENSTELVSDLGELVYQSTLLVSDSKFGIKAEKERQVFGFERALLFARKVEADRQKSILKYELKSKLAISPSIQIVEFIEGEPCKFALVTTDNRLHLKSSSVDIKQDWVRSLRATILNTNTKMAGMENGNGLLSAVANDLMNPSPVAMRKSKSQDIAKHTEFEKYIVKENFHPPPLSPEESTLSLKKGDIVEVLDDSIDGKWFIRAQPVTMASKMDHGWVPSSILEKMDTDSTDTDSTDGKKGWVQITAGPLSGSSDDDKWKALRQNKTGQNKTGFGSHDIQSQQVISALKKVTFGNEAKDEDEEISLDKGHRGRPRSMTAPEIPPPDISVQPPSLPELNRSQSSPSSSPKHTNSDNSLSIADAEGTEWTKTQWRKKVIKRKKSDPRSVSVSSDISEMGEVFHDEEKLHTSSSEETMDKEEASEMDAKKIEKAHQKLEFILTELLQTEKDYLGSLERLINGYLKEMQSPNLPDSLKGMEKLIFGNIQEVFKFHDTTFLSLLEESSGDVEKTASCFAEHAHRFEVYVTYCENKPKSESFIWTYHHNGGTFFEEVQTQLGHKQGINSFLIRPVQRITKYKLLLSDLHKTAKKAQLDTPILEKALSLMEEIPKRANDAMTLSMICGYDGNIHSYGQLIAHDEFTVCERSRRTAAKRHVFLQDQRLILTKEKDADGMYVFKDSLKIHSLSVAEKEGDNPCRFAVGTGSVESWEQYYVLEAASAEKKEQWVQSIKEILKGQFELLKALQGPRPRSKTFDVSTQPSPSQQNDSVAMINLSDDSEQEDEEYQPPPTPKTTTFSATLPRSQGPTHTVAEPTPSTPPIQTRPFDLYCVAEDCAPPKDNEGIMYVRRGQIYDVLDSSSDWWLARLIKDVGTEGGRVCEQGWVPGSFLDKYEGKLSSEEEAAIQNALQQKRLRKLSVKMKKELSSGDSPVFNRYTSNTLPVRTKSNGTSKKIKKSKQTQNKITITSSLSFETNTTSEPVEKNNSLGKEQEPKGPEIVVPLSSETVIAGRSIQLKCEIKSCVHPAPSITWLHDGIPLSIDRAFTNCGEKMCVLKINDVQRSDEGQYACNISNKMGVVTSTATLTVLSHPEAPGQPRVRPLSSSSVALSWDAPLYTGNSTITLYLVECKDTLSDKWSTIMKRITEPSAMIDDLVPGSEYVFRVIAGNQIGSSEPSAESVVTQMASPPLSSEFSLEQFDGNYELLDEIGRGHYGMVYKCMHSSTHQMCAAKLLPLDVGRDHAQHELSMLGQVAHPNLTQMMSGYLTQTHYIILFQLIPGVNVFEFFSSRDSVSEAETAVAIGQVVCALCYLHQANIAHLDIKPENIMAVEIGESNVPEIKLVHFERSRKLLPDTDVIVTRLYEEIDFEVPEVLLGQPVSMETDMWSLGAVLYTLLTGSSPFLVDSQDLTKENIVKGRVSFPSKIFKNISGKAKDLLTQLLVVNKSKRLSSSKCQSHAWLNQPPSNTLDLHKLRDYMSSRKWQNTDNLKTSSYTLL